MRPYRKGFARGKGAAAPCPIAISPPQRDTGVMTSALPPRFNVSPAQIDAVVADFYAAIRHHATLGPVFAAHVTDWPEHEAKIAGFWRNAILMERSYDGNPMQAHKVAGDVRPGMFEPWLGLFDQVLARQLPPDLAAAWSALAHRIGRALRMGLIETANGPPRFT